MSTQDEEEQKKIIRMKIIYRALEDGWSVKRSDTDSKTFEFTKNKSLDDKYKGLVIFGRNGSANICEDIQKHLENLSSQKKAEKKYERSVSAPITKKTND